MTSKSKSPAALGFFALALVTCVALVALAGCSPAAKSLDGTHWRLTGWTLSSLNPADFAITAQFADGKVSGNSGVNSYSGEYRLGPGDGFSVGPVAGTRMAGEEAAMRAETAFLTLLGEAKSFRRTDGQLTLHDAAGAESLRFAAASR